MAAGQHVNNKFSEKFVKSIKSCNKGIKNYYKKMMVKWLTTSNILLLYRQIRKEKRKKKMTREEITKKINEVEAWIMYEECAEYGYNAKAVYELKAKLRDLEKTLKELD